MSQRKGNALLALGGLCVAAALALTCWNLREQKRAQELSAAAVAQLSAQPAPPAGKTPDYQVAPTMEMPTVEVDGDLYVGRVTIPRLGLELPVLSEWDNALSKKAPCRHKGSAYTDDLILAGHNYRTHFGYIDNLDPGDEVLFTDVDGNVFRYEMVEMLWLDGSDVDGMDAGDWDLTLYTCTLAGSQRITVRCVRTDKM